LIDSQAIAGTIVRVEKSENNYCYVQTPDLYYGWIAQSRLIEVWDHSAYDTVCIKTLFAQVFSEPNEDSSPITKLVIDTRLPLTKNKVEPFVEILLPNKQTAYVHKSCIESWSTSLSNNIIFEEKWRESKNKEREELIRTLGMRVVSIAKDFVGTPYLWGGSTPFSIDCSALTQLCYRLNAVQLLRDSHTQWDDKRFKKIEIGKALDQALLEAGDLLAFDIDQEGKMDHIGIACGNGTFIHTRGERKSGGVIIDSCTDEFYKQTYWGAARLSLEADIKIAASA
jgi:hypothetical protein